MAKKTKARPAVAWVIEMLIFEDWIPVYAFPSRIFGREELAEVRREHPLCDYRLRRYVRDDGR